MQGPELVQGKRERHRPSDGGMMKLAKSMHIRVSIFDDITRVRCLLTVAVNSQIDCCYVEVGLSGQRRANDACFATAHTPYLDNSEWAR